MTREQAIELVRTAVETMARAIEAEPGGVRPAPWGEPGFHPGIIEGSMENGMRLYKRGLARLDAAPDDVGEDDAAGIAFDMIHGAITLAAATVLAIQSQSIPFELAKDMLARAIPPSEAKPT